MTVAQAQDYMLRMSQKFSWTKAETEKIHKAAQIIRYARRRKYANNPVMTLEQATRTRLSEIADIAESGQTELTGKVRRGGDRDDVVGRFGGMKPMYPELNQLSAGPKQIAKTIRKGKGLAYRRVYAVVEAAMSKKGYEPSRSRSRGRTTVSPHTGRKSCKHCRADHTTSEHRFHGPGSFHKTHLWGFNPPREPVVIYPRVLAVYAQKQGPHRCDAECKRFNHNYVHEFKPGAVMYGLPNGDLLIRSDK